MAPFTRATASRIASPIAASAHVAGEDAVARRQHAALLDALHHLADLGGVEHAAAPRAIAGVVGELHSVNRPDLDAEPLQRKHRRGVADMAVGDVRLDREDVHRAIFRPSA